MSTCYITSGVQLDCSFGIGGIKSIYILGGAGATVSGYTTEANGSITGMTGTGTFYNFELKRQTSSLQQIITKNYENGSLFYDNELKVRFYKYDATKRDQVRVLAQNDKLKIIAVDQNDVQYYLGSANGMYLSAGTAQTGTQFADGNTWEITFKGMEPELARVIDGVLSSVWNGSIA